MPTGSDGILTATWRPEVAAVSLEVDGAGWGAGVRTNLAADPRATTNGIPSGQARWAPRWFGSGGAGTTSAITGAADGPEVAAGVRIPTYLRKTWTTAGGVGDTGFDHTVAAATGGLPVVAGKPYTLSSYMRASRNPGGATVAHLRMAFSDAAGATIGPVHSATTPLVAGAWARASLTATAPAGAAFVSLLSDVSGGDSWQPGDTLDGTGLLVEQSSVLGPYFDGATVPARRPDAIAEWTGAPNASTSTLTTLAITDVRIDRRVAGESVVPVRGADRVPAVGGYWVGTDHEQPLESSVTYQAVGYTSAGAQVLSAMVTVSTSGAAHGIWLKAAGAPNLTVRLGMVERGARSSVTQGGVYNVTGGRGVAVAAASGRDGDAMTLRVRAQSTAELESAAALLDEHRVLLIQPVAAVRPFRAGWWFVSSVDEALLTQADRADYWDLTLNLARVGVPAGAGQGVIGWSWDAVEATFDTWDDVQAEFDSWFAFERGA